MRTKLLSLMVVVLLVAMAVPTFAATNDTTKQDEELQALYSQMYELQQKIAEKRGEQLPQFDEDFFRQMYNYCNSMMGGYGMMGYGVMGYGMMGY
ncbi:MAG: hypothetical protein H0Z35_01640 [Thermoanaerobacteraceae bacterium]|nr:hypothetical protein [Thermoanaerobacteraceae bacterium]